MPVVSGKQKLINRVTDLIREGKCIQMLCFHLDPNALAEFNRVLSSLPHRPRRDLHELVELNERNLKEMRDHYAVKAPSKALLRVLTQTESVPDGKSIMISKHIYSTFFKHPERYVADYARLPLHARFEFNVRHMDSVEIWILEAVFYEDMCALYNAWVLAERGLTARSPKSERKRASALYRSMIVSVFNFEESFLNGLAYEHYLANEKSLSQATKDELREWDSKRNQSRYLSFRAKLLVYPRLISGSATPPLQESNCAEMKFLLEKSKILRDAVAHASPGMAVETTAIGKEEIIMNPDPEEAKRAVDAAISLARKLNIACKHTPDRLFWLDDRAQDGLFPSKVFN